MITLLVGHRGAGKTTILNGLAGLDQGLRCRDLDAEIEAKSGSAVTEIIETAGLAEFRAIEERALAALVQGGAVDVVALGAGYGGPIPEGVQVIWIRRDTDQDGRIFLDRPRLDPSVDPLREYLDRFPERDARFRRLADRVVTLPEGLDFSRLDLAEEQRQVVCDYLRGRLPDISAVVTLLPDHAESPVRCRSAVSHLLSLGVDIELRDDLLDDQTIGSVFGNGPAERLLYSARREGGRRPGEVQRVDWDITLGAPPDGCAILSHHPLGSSAADDIVRSAARLEEAACSQPEAHLKFAPVVTSFEALQAGHRWVEQAPDRRSFLPVSPDGRWAWYRLLGKGLSGLQYVREGVGSAPDQPTVLQWALAVSRDRAREGENSFAAFLGDPARHTRTPTTHQAFFAARGQSVVAIRVSEDEWPEAMPFLESLGMTAAAVSAPLKRLAFDWCDHRGPVADRTTSVNTLHLRQGKWWGGSTDGQGLEGALADLPLDPSQVATAVWGGGGLTGVLNDALSAASYYSARSGELRSGPRLVGSPELVVYASGRGGAPLPEDWCPSCVFDLDYRENTPAREYALGVGAEYVSGVRMFEAQAEVQQRHWADADSTA